MSALFRRVSFVSVLVTCGHLLFGSIVSGTGSGMGCGPYWPLCQGQLFPALSDSALVIEWTHRLFAVLVGLSVLAVAVVAWRRERASPGTLWLSTAALVLVILVGVLGGITVLRELPKEISTAHFALGVLLFALLVVLTAKTYSSHTPNAVGTTHRWALLSTILIYLQAVLGAYVRHSQAGMALPLWPFLTFFPNLAISPIAHQWSHRLLALIVLGVVSVTAARAITSGSRALGISSLVVVLIQIALGILIVWTVLNPIVAMLHLAGALTLLGLQLVLVVRCWPLRAVGSVPREVQA